VVDPVGCAPGVPPILSGTPGAFARRVMDERHPALLAQVRAAYPYGPERLARIDRLRAELDGVIEPLPGWEAWDHGYFGRSWLDAPFLWAESCFYHKLLRAVGYDEPGPWRGVDPFGFLKAPELASSTVDDDLAQLAKLPDLSTGERTRVLLAAALWGNRADLGFRIGMAAQGRSAADTTHLVADDSDAILAALAAGRAGRTTVVADNAGRELLADLVLIDHLLATSVREIVLHVKPYPYYVSDAVTADLVACLHRLATGPEAAAAIAHRLQAASVDGRFTVATHGFWGAPLAFHAMPADLRAELAGRDLVIVKGDLNYRRLVGDCRWPATMPFREAVAYFPAPVAALRTHKCEVADGVDGDLLARLDSSGQPWRTNGAYGLIQATA
jgi:uncharacterized protein with ATP-grasp and redox domains